MVFDLCHLSLADRAELSPGRANQHVFWVKLGLAWGMLRIFGYKVRWNSQWFTTITVLASSNTWTYGEPSFLLGQHSWGRLYIYTYILGFCLAIAQLKVQKKKHTRSKDSIGQTLGWWNMMKPHIEYSPIKSSQTIWFNLPRWGDLGKCGKPTGERIGYYRILQFLAFF